MRIEALWCKFLVSAMPVRIILADDHTMVRQGLKAILQTEGFEIVGDASNGRDAIKLCEMVHPDVAVMDISMPLLNGIDAVREIARVAPRTKVILLTMHTEDHYVLEGLRAGASGYMLKTKAAAELIQAIHEVSRGGTYLSPTIARTVVQAFLTGAEVPTDPLSARERQVLQLVAEGHTTKEIAAELGISVKTAESHRSNIMEKLHIHDTAGLVRYAIRCGLVKS
jgi:DNA-binding NarL/FixJ family response regulator